MALAIVQTKYLLKQPINTSTDWPGVKQANSLESTKVDHVQYDVPVMTVLMADNHWPLYSNDH